MFIQSSCTATKPKLSRLGSLNKGAQRLRTSQRYIAGLLVASVMYFRSDVAPLLSGLEGCGID